MDGDQRETLRRASKAFERTQQWHGVLHDAYQYALPNHDGFNGRMPGDQRDVEVYDATAPEAVRERKARLHGQLFPAFREWVDFDIDRNAVPAIPGLDAWPEYLEMVRHRFHRAVEASNFHIEVPPALADSLISTGALTVHEGTPDDPLRFEALPAYQLGYEEGPDGVIRTVFRKWSIPGRTLTLRWPDADLPGNAERAIAKDPETDIHLVEAFLWDYEHERLEYEVWLSEGATPSLADTRIVSRQYASSPIIVFRMDKAVGEIMGRGPVLSVLGNIKTANAVVKLVLQNAETAIVGMWQTADNSVINTENLELGPGVIIPRSLDADGLEPLRPAGDFNVSALILSELREGIRHAILGPSLPPQDSRVRTAFEIDVRAAHQQAVEVPESLRLLSELSGPLIRRILDILQHPSLAGSPYYIPPFSLGGGAALRPVPVSPLVKLQEEADAASTIQSYATAAQLFPDLIEVAVDRRKVLNAYLADSRIPESVRRQEEEQVLMLQQQAQQQAQQQQLQALAQMAAGTASAGVEPGGETGLDEQSAGPALA